MLEMYGAQTRTANDGVEALAIAERFAPDIVLMDVSMPRLNGYEAARRIRKAPWGQSMRLIAITGWGHESDVREAYGAGFDGHLLKPVEPDALFGLIRNLRGSPPE
jgi:CheY-like chemotaxis protein